jgi:hypothetical protein
LGLIGVCIALLFGSIIYHQGILAGKEADSEGSQLSAVAPEGDEDHPGEMIFTVTQIKLQEFRISLK